MFGPKKKRETRIYPRWKIDRFIAVYDKDKDTFLGRVQDLSVSGMCVASSEMLPLDNHVRLALEILLDDGETETFVLRCRIQWVRPYDDGGLFLIGFEFSGISPAATARIEQLLRAERKIND